jgi:hypothetical protein
MRPILFIKAEGAGKIHYQNGLLIENVTDAETQRYCHALKSVPAIRRNKIEPFSEQWYAVRFFEKLGRAIKQGGIHA